MTKIIDSVSYDDGYVLCADGTDEFVVQHCVNLISSGSWMIHTDPPYGNIVKDNWDNQFDNGTAHANWMLDWTNLWAKHLNSGSAFYVWGAIGTYNNRPFFEYVSNVEKRSSLKIQNIITWSKRRGIGTKYNYLFTREELIFMLKGNKNVKPNTFNVPYLDELRGYEGFNKKYPAKSPYKRRTNIWMDITELFRNKQHVCEKALRVCEIPIEVSSNIGDWVVDPFAGSGTTALAARKLGRKFILIESDKEIYTKTIKRLNETDN